MESKIKKIKSTDNDSDDLLIKEDTDDDNLSFVGDMEEGVDESVDKDDTIDVTMDEEEMDNLLTQSIQESLMNGNAEVREAAERLLRNRSTRHSSITEKIMDSEVHNDEENDDIAGERTSLLGNTQGNSISSMGALNNFG